MQLAVFEATQKSDFPGPRPLQTVLFRRRVTGAQTLPHTDSGVKKGRFFAVFSSQRRQQMAAVTHLEPYAAD